MVRAISWSDMLDFPTIWVQSHSVLRTTMSASQTQGCVARAWSRQADEQEEAHE